MTGRLTNAEAVERSIDCSLRSPLFDSLAAELGRYTATILSTDDGTMARLESGDSHFATSIAPWLSVPDGLSAVEFYTASFGAVELERLEDDAGRVVVAQLALSGARFWVQMDVDSSPATLGGISVRMIVIVGDPDQLFKRAVAAGATQVASMHEAHGWRTGRVSDPFGHHWEFAKPLMGAR
jgi:PhnB protein